MSKLSQIQMLVRNKQIQPETDGFGAGETCETCGGAIIEKRVTLHRKVKDHYVLLENVPAGVCTECGTRTFSANVLKTIEESVRGRKPAQREELVPIYAL